METQNKIALITGGSRGLGKNAALKIAAKGIDVIVTYQSKKEDAENTVAEIKKLGVNAAALQLSVNDATSFDTFFTEVKSLLKSAFNADKIDFLVNNAGVGTHASFAETTEEQFDNLVNIHFKGPFFLTQKALALLNDGGGIINISTGLARFSLPGYAAYASMKGAMETLTKYQAKELGARGIRSNIVAPGAIETDFSGGAVRDNEQLNKMISAQTALGRAGVPDDIGGLVAFLCTEEARWINAQRIEASGGMFL
ncbi:SDR family NAD(P)-dependent oxidoreductase [Pedobacter nototheniae]|uniref:SDR family NAD(P)-dependent oxidoreductase n=1 Tax=Pedobacter nototheniae TaxID=2488994 RepID=UPI00292D2E6C|nr:SDR family oxidoreductase [Pedobacter nototheniae]